MSAVNVTSMMMDGADFESLTYIDEELQAQEEAEAQREREEEEKRREQERRKQRAKQERRAEQHQREEEASAQREEQQQQQQQATAPAATQQQAPSMEWETLGPYGGFMDCSQAQSMWPSNSTECYQGGDGNYYFNGLRQAMR